MKSVLIPGSLLFLSQTFSIASSASQAMDPAACEAVRSYIPRALEGSVRDIPTFAQLVSARQTRVILMGENHQNSDAISYYPEFFRQLRQAAPEFDCIWMERAGMYQPAIDHYLDGAIDSHELFVRTCDAPCDSTLEHDPDSRFYSDLKLLDSVRGTGTRVFAVDEDIIANRGYVAWYFEKLMEAISEDDEEFDQLAVAFVSLRNKTMARRIRESLESGRCRAGTMIVGSDHVNYDSPRGPVISLATRLKNDRIEAATLYGLRARMSEAIPPCRPTQPVLPESSVARMFQNFEDPALASFLPRYPQLATALGRAEFVLVPPGSGPSR